MELQEVRDLLKNSSWTNDEHLYKFGLDLLFINKKFYGNYDVIGEKPNFSIIAPDLQIDINSIDANNLSINPFGDLLDLRRIS